MCRPQTVNKYTNSFDPSKVVLTWQRYTIFRIVQRQKKKRNGCSPFTFDWLLTNMIFQTNQSTSSSKSKVPQGEGIWFHVVDVQAQWYQICFSCLTSYRN